jgi:type II secretory pathway pseudopilin PulG
MQNIRRKNGFSLVEVLVAVIFVGLAIAALLAGNSAFTQANAVANNLSTAEFLTEQVRERITLANYENLYNYDNRNYCPPIDAKGDVLNDFATFTQKITVENVSNTDFTQVVADNSSHFIRVTVKIYQGTKEISSTSWLRAQY